MTRYYCNGKKDFCDRDKNCMAHKGLRPCEFFDESGGEDVETDALNAPRLHSEIKDVLLHIKQYLHDILDEWYRRQDEPHFYEQNIGVYNHVRKELDDLYAYAEKLGVKLDEDDECKVLWSRPEPCPLKITAEQFNAIYEDEEEPKDGRN